MASWGLTVQKGPWRETSRDRRMPIRGANRHDLDSPRNTLTPSSVKATSNVISKIPYTPISDIPEYYFKPLFSLKTPAYTSSVVGKHQTSYPEPTVQQNGFNPAPAQKSISLDRIEKLDQAYLSLATEVDKVFGQVKTMNDYIKIEPMMVDSSIDILGKKADALTDAVLKEAAKEINMGAEISTQTRFTGSAAGVQTDEDGVMAEQRMQIQAIQNQLNEVRQSKVDADTQLKQLRQELDQANDMRQVMEKEMTKYANASYSQQAINEQMQKQLVEKSRESQLYYEKLEQYASLNQQLQQQLEQAEMGFRVQNQQLIMTQEQTMQYLQMLQQTNAEAYAIYEQNLALQGQNQNSQAAFQMVLQHLNQTEQDAMTYLQMNSQLGATVNDLAEYNAQLEQQQQILLNYADELESRLNAMATQKETADETVNVMQENIQILMAMVNDMRQRKQRPQGQQPPFAPHDTPLQVAYQQVKLEEQTRQVGEIEGTVALRRPRRANMRKPKLTQPPFSIGKFKKPPGNPYKGSI